MLLLIPNSRTSYWDIPVLLKTLLQAPPHRYMHFDLSIFKTESLDFLLDCELHQRHMTFAPGRIMGNHELCTHSLGEVNRDYCFYRMWPSVSLISLFLELKAGIISKPLAELIVVGVCMPIKPSIIFLSR